MSLINQALRKAEHDRKPGRADSQNESNATPYRSAAPSSPSGLQPGLIIGLIVIVALLVGVVAGLSLVLFKDNNSPSTTTLTIAQPAVVPLQPASVKPAETAPTPSSSQSTSSSNDEAAPSLIEELRFAREAAEAKAAAETKAAEEAARLAALKPSQDIIAWLSQSKVSGVRLSQSGNKVILNGKAHEVGDIAHFSLGLKVLAIEEKRVLFIDDNGKKYMKRL